MIDDKIEKLNLSDREKSILLEQLKTIGRLSLGDWIYAGALTRNILSLKANDVKSKEWLNFLVQNDLLISKHRGRQVQYKAISGLYYWALSKD